MAAPKTVPTKLQQEQTRAAIQTTQLVKRLQAFALGLPEPNAKQEGDEPPIPCELDANRLRAIEILLRKALPDLSAVAHTGEDGGPLQIQIVRLADNPSA